MIYLDKIKKQIINAIKKRNFYEVENLCNQFLKTDSSNPLINYNLAIALFSLGKINEAQKNLKRL
jgi:predicted Zn-dependent protease